MAILGSPAFEQMKEDTTDLGFKDFILLFGCRTLKYQMFEI